jgi:hypothetical protein
MECPWDPYFFQSFWIAHGTTLYCLGLAHYFPLSGKSFHTSHPHKQKTVIQKFIHYQAVLYKNEKELFVFNVQELWIDGAVGQHIYRFFCSRSLPRGHDITTTARNRADCGG